MSLQQKLLKELNRYSQNLDSDQTEILPPNVTNLKFNIIHQLQNELKNIDLAMEKLDILHTQNTDSSNQLSNSTSPNLITQLARNNLISHSQAAALVTDPITHSDTNHLTQNTANAPNTISQNLSQSTSSTTPHKSTQISNLISDLAKKQSAHGANNLTDPYPTISTTFPRSNTLMSDIPELPEKTTTTPSNTTLDRSQNLTLTQPSHPLARSGTETTTESTYHATTIVETIRNNLRDLILQGKLQKPDNLETEKDTSSSKDRDPSHHHHKTQHLHSNLQNIEEMVGDEEVEAAASIKESGGDDDIDDDNVQTQSCPISMNRYGRDSGAVCSFNDDDNETNDLDYLSDIGHGSRNLER